jgi:hypothetical protein
LLTVPALACHRSLEAGGQQQQQQAEEFTVRPMTLHDFQSVLQHMRPATQAAEEYKLSSSMGGKGSGAGMHDMMELFMQMLMAGQAGGRNGGGAGGSGRGGPSSGSNGSNGSHGGNGNSNGAH